ncbi:MAG: hypothetical protein AUI83_23620 [Armatimonadetes bacterium 13_1_40CM_3_65_7]|nr:MAG: hypothetical protein AUI83_23620 [Armatimonadetes bacterium 13_1_40CM_3_65_7]
MPEFQLVPSKRFEDDFRELPKKIQSQVLKALDRIKTDPYHGQKLRGVKIGQYRYRVGDYRIRYDIERLAIYLHVVRHRSEVYRK